MPKIIEWDGYRFILLQQLLVVIAIIAVIAILAALRLPVSSATMAADRYGILRMADCGQSASAFGAEYG